MIYFTDNKISILDVHLGIDLQDPYEPSDIIIIDDEYTQTHYLSEIITYFTDIPTSDNNKVSKDKYEIIIRKITDV